MSPGLFFKDLRIQTVNHSEVDAFRSVTYFLLMRFRDCLLKQEEIQKNHLTPLIRPLVEKENKLPPLALISAAELPCQLKLQQWF
jgi:hypothetical protein